VTLETRDLPFAVTTTGEGPGAPVVVLPGGPCRGPEYLGDLAGLGETRPLAGIPSDAGSVAQTHATAEERDALAAMTTDDPATESGFGEAFRRQAPAGYARWTAVEQAHAQVGAVSLASALAWSAGIPGDVGDRVRAATLPPALVVAGDRDLLTGVEPVAAYARLIGAGYALVDDCGHYPWVEQPQAFRRCLDAWLSSRG